MKRLHVVGGKNHGKTTLIADLLKELLQRGVAVGTIKHTHHHHELDVPGKDSHRHRVAGANVVGILSPSMDAIFLPNNGGEGDRYELFAPMFESCHLVLVEGDSTTSAPKIEVWRGSMGTNPLCPRDSSIMAVVTDDELPTNTLVLPRGDMPGLADWICSEILAKVRP